MSKRNLVWILAVVLLVLLFWQMPETAQRQQTFYNTFAPLADISAKIQKNYVQEVPDQKLLEGSIEGMLKRLDPFSRYIPPSEQDRFDGQISGDIYGIGIFPNSKSGILTVLSPIEDSPAYRAGILPGDQILRIDDEPTKNMTWSEASTKLTGEVGTKLTLEVRHELTGLVEKISLIRDTVHVHSVKGFVRKASGGWDYMIDPKNRIGYIRITSFLAHTADELDQAYRQLLQENVQGLIIDLRFDPGGLLPTAVAIANRFLESGKIVSTKGRYQETMVWKATRENTYKHIPMAVLVNRYTASAAEILSGALRDHKRATVIGERTYGKGSVQTLIPLDNGFGLIKLTTAHYYLPCGKNIHRLPNAKEWGVDPDVKVPLSVTEQLRIKNDRGQADVFWGRLPASLPADAQTTINPQPKSLLIDRQIKTAIDLLSEKITTTNKGNESEI